MFGLNSSPICGEKHDSWLDGYSENIESKNITSFNYTGPDFFLSAKKKENNKIEICCNGGGKENPRDGSLFKIKYESTDNSIFKKLQEVIDKNKETKGNGHCVHVDGLPGGIGDKLEVEYSSGEKIYKSSNQNHTISSNSSKSFYDIFHEYIKKDGYDFNEKGSNIELFDDADEEFVQGTWKGKHFGDEIEVTFNKDLVTIKINDIITDNNVPYIIYEGSIRKNKLKEEIGKIKSKNDFEEFNGVSYFSKKNDFTMSTYFQKVSYSTCEIMNFDKTKK